MRADIDLTVSEFLAIFNQTIEYAYPNVSIVGELANFRVSKGRWVYFDLKDQSATVRLFGTVFQLPGPLEDGMMLKVNGVPRLHPQFGFSINVFSIVPVGRGAIKKAADLLEAKLRAEGLFDVDRKRSLPYPPKHIGLITSVESAAYRDFIKVLQARWSVARVSLIDVQVQGDVSPEQIVSAVLRFNQLSDAPDVLVITRGGGSAEDLQGFSTEQVTRAIAMSRIPTLVAIGHEIDVCLAELAADQRASTPSNAAEMLVPYRKAVLKNLQSISNLLDSGVDRSLKDAVQQLNLYRRHLDDTLDRLLQTVRTQLGLKQKILTAFDPNAALQKGYALVRLNDALVMSGNQIRVGDEIEVTFSDAYATATINKVAQEEGKS